jgi:hypothetical protein
MYPDGYRLEGAVAACNSKKLYRSAEAAGKGAESAKLNGSKDDLRVYLCGVCDGFHLTKSDLLEYSSKAYNNP